MMVTTINPATGKKIKDYPEASQQEISEAMRRAQKAGPLWAQRSFSDRAKVLIQAASILESKTMEYARLMALEMGKPVTQGQSEIEKSAKVCRLYAEKAEQYLAPVEVSTEASRSYVSFEPLGTLFAIMPWNFPFWQVFRAAAPALMAGNVFILKHASNVLGCAEIMEKIFCDANAPEGVFQSLVLNSHQAGEVIRHPAVHAVTLTGSVRAGRAVASAAGEALKKCVLELGGSDPYLILSDADVDEAAVACSYSRLINSGQSCIAAKRFIVVPEVKEAFEKALVREMSKVKPGDPLEKETLMGPLARLDLREEIHQQVEKSIAQGARLLLGGKMLEGSGAYYPPTVLSGVKKGMTAFDEETFGPVAAIIPAADEAEAIKFANDSEFGLGGAVFTRDQDRGEKIARDHLRVGCAFVNTFVRSDPRLPFGGIRDSGYGRELGDAGIKEFVNVKTVFVK